jgi:hypothetical protein
VPTGIDTEDATDDATEDATDDGAELETGVEDGADDETAGFDEEAGADDDTAGLDDEAGADDDTAGLDDEAGADEDTAGLDEEAGVPKHIGVTENQLMLKPACLKAKPNRISPFGKVTSWEIVFQDCHPPVAPPMEISPNFGDPPACSSQICPLPD